MNTVPWTCPACRDGHCELCFSVECATEHDRLACICDHTKPTRLAKKMMVVFDAVMANLRAS